MMNGVENKADFFLSSPTGSIDYNPLTFPIKPSLGWKRGEAVKTIFNNWLNLRTPFGACIH